MRTASEGVLDRAVQVLGCFDEDDPQLTARQLGDRTGIAPSTLHRVLGHLLRIGWLVRVPGRRYAVGSRLWELGELSPLALRLRETALPHMVRLYEATGENVHLAVLDGEPEHATALYVGRLTGQGSIPTLSRMGSRHPLHTTGVGKALLATRDATWIERFLTTPLQAETRNSITDPDALRADLERTRVRGLALTREEMTLGNASVAAALGNVPGLPPAAIGIVAHLERVDVRRLGTLVSQAARELTAALLASP